mgnify:CR=1 FL=1
MSKTNTTSTWINKVSDKEELNSLAKKLFMEELSNKISIMSNDLSYEQLKWLGKHITHRGKVLQEKIREHDSWVSHDTTHNELEELQNNEV